MKSLNSANPSQQSWLTFFNCSFTNKTDNFVLLALASFLKKTVPYSRFSSSSESVSITLVNHFTILRTRSCLTQPLMRVVVTAPSSSIGIHCQGCGSWPPPQQGWLWSSTGSRIIMDRSRIWCHIFLKYVDDWIWNSELFWMSSESL